MTPGSDNPLLDLQQQSQAIAPLAIQPLELIDFSGGLTENYYDSTPNRYKAANNFIITVDKKLQMRPGMVPFDFVNYKTGNSNRVDALFTLVNETRLIVNQGRELYVMPENVVSPTWTRLAGPSGNPALGAGLPSWLGAPPFNTASVGSAFSTQFGLTTAAEFQHQLWVTQDSQPIPSRVYRDSSNNYAVRTAGLPRLWNAPNYTAGTLLAKCITNANAIQAAFVNHLNDFPSVTTTFPFAGASTSLHRNQDKWSLGYISSSYPAWNSNDSEYPGPVPAVTAAPAATNQATLFALVGALNSAYTHHATSAASYLYYHWECIIPPLGKSTFFGGSLNNPGPKATLSNNTTPTTLLQAAGMLDDLYQKLYWHFFAINTHGGVTNSIAMMSRYDFTSTISKIGTINYNAATGLYINASPVVTPMIQDFLDYVNGLQALYNWHVQGGGGIELMPQAVPGMTFPGLPGNNNSNVHIVPDMDNICTLPLSTTLDQAFLKIYWLRNLYGPQHALDANNLSATGIKFTCTAGSTSLTSIINSTTSAAITLPTNCYIYSGATTLFTSPVANMGQGGVGIVLVSASGTATLDRPVTNAQTQLQAYISPSTRRYHGLFSGGLPIVANNYNPSSGGTLTTSALAVGTDLITWNAYAQELMYAMLTHFSDTSVHMFNNLPINDISTLGSVNSPGISNWYIPTVSTVSFAFTYYYTWTVEPNGIQYVIESNPVFSASVETIEPVNVGLQVALPVQAQAILGTTATFNPIQVQNPIVVSSIPALVNDGSTNYDTANVMVNVYRTTNGGTTFYLDQQIANGLTTFNDTQNSTYTPPGQTTLNLNQVLYTSGGVVGNDQPPPAKCVHICNGTAYYGNIIQAGQYLPNTICQALPQNPDSSPATFTDTLDDEVVAISSARTNVIVFCRNSIYRLSGSFNSLGQGAISHEKFSTTIGCVSPHSVVQTEIGVFFAGTDGFYYTDAFQIIKVSIDLNSTYKAATQTLQQKARVYGAYDKTTRRIWWGMQSQPTAADNDICYIFYLDYGIKPGGVFTTASNNGALVPSTSTASPSPSVGNPLNYDYWSPSAMVFFQGQLIKGDSRGILTKSDPNSTADPKVDLTVPAYTFSSGVPTANWNTVPMPFDFTTTSMAFGTHWKRKYATKVNWTGKNMGNAQVQFVAISDNGRVVGNMAPINYVGNTLWGSPNVPWGATSSPQFPWYYGGSADFWRRFPAGTLRANLRQVQLTNAFMGVYRSQDYPSGSTATPNNSTKVVSLVTPSNYTGTLTWPLDVVDYYLTLASDGYVTQYQIVAVSGANITVLDPNNKLPASGSYAWVIMGYKKNMTFSIEALVIRYAVFGDKTTAYTSGADSGMNT
jgi:hypothetical protein